jgi:hypothetical protein
MTMKASGFSSWSTPHGSALIAVLLVCVFALLALSGCGGNTAGGGASPVAAASPAGGSRPVAADPVPAIAAIAVHEATDAVADTAAQASTAIEDPAADAQEAVASIAAPVVLAVREAVEQVMPSPPPVAVPETGPVAALVSPAAVDLIVSFEVVSRPYYSKRLQGVVCPPRQSGPTRGIGWDDGHQTRNAIAAAWPMHPQLERILPASGQLGATKCNAYRRANLDIRTPLDMAERVFIETALPAYHALTARTFRNGWDRLPPNAQGALVATVYNRGAAMAAGKSPNDPRKEMRTLRDVCVPAGDVQCMAEQFLAMRRLWPPNSEGGKGLQRRYTATAKLAVQA